MRRLIPLLAAMTVALAVAISTTFGTKASSPITISTTFGGAMR